VIKEHEDVDSLQDQIAVMQYVPLDPIGAVVDSRCRYVIANLPGRIGRSPTDQEMTPTQKIVFRQRQTWLAGLPATTSSLIDGHMVDGGFYPVRATAKLPSRAAGPASASESATNWSLEAN